MRREAFSYEYGARYHFSRECKRPQAAMRQTPRVILEKLSTVLKQDSRGVCALKWNWCSDYSRPMQLPPSMSDKCLSCEVTGLPL